MATTFNLQGMIQLILPQQNPTNFDAKNWDTHNHLVGQSKLKPEDAYI
jgi:hypothetical protein